MWARVAAVLALAVVAVVAAHAGKRKVIVRVFFADRFFFLWFAISVNRQDGYPRSREAKA